MTGRIDALFARLQAEDRAAFVAYVMAGDPDAEQSLSTLHALAEAGADMIELGFPFSDPMAEGPPIQRAALRSLAAGTSLAGTLEIARLFRLRSASWMGLWSADPVGRILALAAPGHFVQETVDIDLVDDWLAIEAEKHGLAIHGFAHAIGTDGVRHVLKKHGKTEVERSRGQVPVTPADLLAIPKLLTSYQSVVFGLRTKAGQDAVGLIWERADDTTLMIEAALRGRQRLTLRTMWKWPTRVAGGVSEARLATVPDQHVRNAPQLSGKIVRRPLDVKPRQPALPRPITIVDRQGNLWRPESQIDTPLILMGYLNPLLSYGLERFALDAASAGVDGLIVVDCPPEEADPLADALEAQGIALIRLATPTTDARRLPAVLQRSSGFVYYVSVAGVTGAKAADAEAIAPAVARIRAASSLPVAVGFGIRTPEQAAAVARIADAAVVGSALVDEVALAVAAGESPAQRVGVLAAELARAVRTARS